MTAVVELPAVLRGYLDELVTAFGGVEAVYVVGSAARGTYRHGPSDVDVVAVVPRPLSRAEKEELVARVERLDCPARGLELVVYARGSQPPDFEVNFNGGPRMDRHVSFDPAEESWHWFVIDAALAEQHAVPLVGPPWAELFEPITPERARAAVRASLDVPDAAANRERALRYLETGEWTEK